MKRLPLLIVTAIVFLLVLGTGLGEAGPAGDDEQDFPEGLPEAQNDIDEYPEEEITAEYSDNPDGLDGPAEIPAPPLIYPGAGDSSVPALSPASVTVVPGPNKPDNHGNIEPWGIPGSLELTKSAAPVEGEHNRWQVTLTLEGKDREVQTTSDIVLVIDRSGSMAGNRMSAAKNAAKEFVNTLLGDAGDSTTRIAVVSFAGNVTVDSQFEDVTGQTALISAVDNLSAGGGTFTQAGIRQAKLLFANSTADYKSIVLLSDGEPTYSYGIKNIKNNGTYFVKVGNRWYTRDDLDESKYNYSTTAGNGTSMTTRRGLLSSYYYHHGHSAIAESGFCSGITFYVVGFDVGSDGRDMLTRMVSPGRYYAATAENLETIFHDIAGSVSHIAAARDATVTDLLGDMFSIPDITADNCTSKITVDRGEVTYDPGTGTITWSIPFIGEGSAATMSYTVEIGPDAQSGVLYPTNKPTYVDYTNVENESARKHFPIPKVAVEALGKIKITKKVEPGGSTTKRFPIYVEGNGHTWSMLLAHGQSATITGLAPGDYTIREVVPMDYKLVPGGQGTVKFTVDNLAETFEVTLTNRKVNDSWFRDEDERINTFRVRASNGAAHLSCRAGLSGRIAGASIVRLQSPPGVWGKT